MSLKNVEIPETIADKSNAGRLRAMTPAGGYEVPKPRKGRAEYARIQVVTAPEFEEQIRMLQGYRQTRTTERYTESRCILDIVKAYFESDEGRAELAKAAEHAERIRNLDG